MARVTVEDCIDKVPNRFELVLLAAHRARVLAKGAQMAVDPENDKNTVIGLRELAEKKLQPNDVREGLIHSMLANAEVDEPESAAAPTMPSAEQPVLGRDHRSMDTVVDELTEDQLLSGMQRLLPMEPSNGGRGRIPEGGA